MVAFPLRSTRISVALTAAGVLAVLTGCTAPLGNACSAIGWLNMVDVTLTGSTQHLEQVAWVEFCDADACSSSTQQPATTRATTEPLPLYTASSTGLASWAVNVGMAQPQSAIVTAYGTDSSVLGTVSTALRWNRVGGSEQCGGPGQANPITLHLLPL